MVKTHNRIIAGVLSTLMVGQVTFFGDGTTKGILHPDTIAYAAEEIKTRANERELAEEFERAIQGIGEVDYFDSSSSSTTNSTRRTRSLSSTSPLRTTSSSPLESFPTVAHNLTVSGIVSSLEGCDVSNAKVIIFNADWQDIATANVNSDGSFSVTATGFTSTATHVKIECNGYLPRFYRNMGYGSYDLGENILIPGDTSYNPDHNNEWSDETIDEHDLAFAYDAVGARRATGDYVADYDLNNDGNIFTSEISQINSKSFAKNSSTVFYSCRTGKKFNNVSFAQEWANTTGGTVKAATNRTDYTHIYPNPIPGLDSINSILGYSGRSPRQEARYIHGYSTSGSKNYPKGKWKTFTPK